MSPFSPPVCPECTPRQTAAFEDAEDARLELASERRAAAKRAGLPAVDMKPDMEADTVSLTAAKVGRPERVGRGRPTDQERLARLMSPAPTEG